MPTFVLPTPDEGGRLDALIGGLERCLPAVDHWSLALPTNDRRQLLLVATGGLGTGVGERHAVTERSVMGEAFLSGRARIVEELPAESSLTDLVAARRAGLRSLASVPLASDGEVFGVLNVASARARTWEEELPSLLGVTQLAASQLRAGRGLREEGERRAAGEALVERLARVTQIGLELVEAETEHEVLTLATRGFPPLVDVMRLSVNLVTPDGKHVTIHPLYGPSDRVPAQVELDDLLVAQAIRSCALLEVPDMSTRTEPDSVWARGIGVRGGVVAPLVAAEACLGCINFARSAPGCYSAHELALIRHIAATLTFALASVRSRVRVARALRMRDDCLTVLAHELRTPLHAVVGMSQLLAGEEVPARLQPMISTVRDGAELLASAVDTVLEYSENKEGLTLQATEFDVGELVDRVVRLVRVDLDARELGLTATVDLARPIVCADRERLQQILLNLVASAVKFTAAGSVSIALRGGAAPAELEGRVRCVGWTIPRHLLPELFEPFHELPTLRRERLANTGLGLAICKQLCAAMGGTIRAESGPEGTVFVFTVVAPPVEGRAVRPAEEALAPFDVLVVDDSPVNRAVAEAMLGRLGFTCTLASSGAEARERYRERAYDLVLMDVNMPEEDGPSVARALLAGPGPHAAFVALTADTAGRARQLCEDAGIRCLVTKPLRLERLEALLRRVVPRTAEASARIAPASAVESGGERP